MFNRKLKSSWSSLSQRKTGSLVVLKRFDQVSKPMSVNQSLVLVSVSMISSSFNDNSQANAVCLPNRFTSPFVVFLLSFLFSPLQSFKEGNEGAKKPTRTFSTERNLFFLNSLLQYSSHENAAHNLSQDNTKPLMTTPNASQSPEINTLTSIN